MTSNAGLLCQPCDWRYVMTETVNRSELYQKAYPIPAGIYHGTWSGYEVHFEFNGIDYWFQTELGVRGINIPVKIDLRRDKIVVSTHVD